MKLLETITEFRAKTDHEEIVIKGEIWGDEYYHHHLVSEAVDKITENGQFLVVHLESGKKIVVGDLNFIMGVCDCCENIDAFLSKITKIEVWES